MKHAITLALDSGLIEEIKRRAAAEDRSRSHVANALLQAGLAAADPKAAQPTDAVQS
jgi:hypothetical protein